MADLSKHSMSESSVLTLRTPDKKLSDIEIDLVNKYSPRYVKARAQAFRELIDGGEKPDEDVSAEVSARICAKCTTGWRNLQWEGEDVEFSEEKAYEIYSDPQYGWMLDQVDGFIHKESNFLGKSQAG
jgi:hypothetical protein